ncbi:Alginate biosynthesis protein AlgA [compost metagenome]
MLFPVIICGGAGSRLWPVSREAHPKPFMPLPDGQNLLQKTLQRALDLEGVSEVLTVTNRELFFKTEDEYRAINGQHCHLSYVLEPFGRNTAAAVVSAAIHLKQVHGPEAVMLVLPADHLIQNTGAFATAVSDATRLARNGWLVTFGIEPQYPETGFGYIESSTEPLDGGLKVKRFVEKPDLATAQEYMQAGNYFWNSGMIWAGAISVHGRRWLN